MRKKTNPSAQTTPKSPSTQPSSGLIAADKKRQQSAGAECVLDNRSHRTPSGSAASSSSIFACKPTMLSPAASRLKLPARLLHPPVRLPTCAVASAPMRRSGDRMPAYRY